MPPSGFRPSPIPRRRTREPLTTERDAALAELLSGLVDYVAEAAALITAVVAEGPPQGTAEALARVVDLLAAVATDLAAVSALYAEAAAEIGHLETALSNRVIIEQAKGVVAGRAAVTPEVAWARLRRYARRHNVRASEAAAAVVDGTMTREDFATLLEPL